MADAGKPIAAALVLYLVWTAATWMLEGRIETLLRPDAVVDRMIYAIVANLIIGIVGGLALLRVTLAWTGAARGAAGFGSAMRTVLAVVAGLILGLAFYVVSGGATSNPAVIINAFAQVLVVSAAEVIVCWVVVGSIVEATAGGGRRWIATLLAALVASVLFGIYHYAHSAPFNTLQMVAFLSVIGLVTSVFFFVSRDVYGTIVFHNFLGVLGVVNALAAEGQLEPMMQLQAPLLVTALVTVAIVVLADRFLLRPARPT